MKINEKKLQRIIQDEYAKILIEEELANDPNENSYEEYRKLIRESLNEHAKDYVWGVKAPYGRTANQYAIAVPIKARDLWPLK
mgnify:CR=1 FL=1|jgi:hypothetical protein|tara:strand:- start:179 stop:427 length:249 start_codon:yes stop_codon:yes gene_type:complete